MFHLHKSSVAQWADKKTETKVIDIIAQRQRNYYNIVWKY
jgi:hypothetical protein